ncbi:alpha-(1,3)-fucosyltransferase C-like [Daphnia pulex]|uniref:alpha-(1,3)-fucosyltransferase C-like n=1 Tax=Daphnia pulex TaxID=6669 RepID=UPI001EE0741D|nr:alpha-(1,3)-fucosyltransferase C-like [Daphnia pulex]XP_046451561.1 alpha-(1,3)-fucosyltransferase C-like [Daphnia pulex]XP_046451562.1 alpha-(1,3)-fucosyltransferase C-like [Daphnia pulex]
MSNNLFNTVSQKRIALFATLLCILILTFFVFNTPIFHSHDLSEYETIKKNCSGKQLVLFWTKFFETDDFYVGLGIKPFKQCTVFACCSTNNRNFLDVSDAIIFHIRDLDLNDMPPRRSVRQRWIFYLQESPLHTPNILYDLSNVFNWTMTFRMDSDIYTPYPVVETTPGSALELQIWNTTFNRNKLKHNVRRKKKLLAWFVSNCFTTSGREKYVLELQKYVEVDVYGTCGNLTCSHSDHIECYKMLERDYKFYLAFENSICKDYVTEKFYNALLFNVVPVVYGGANYHALAPKNSYIDVRDFSSVHHFVKYLKFLARNDSAYLHYFDWRKTPPGLSLLPRTNQGWCTLCSMLNNDSLPSHSYSNIHSWWFEKGQCEKDRTSIQKLAI